MRVKLIFVSRRNAYVLRWTDPDGTVRQESTGTNSHRKASRLRADKEVALEGSYATDCGWELFAELYREEGLAGRAKSTVDHWGSVRARIEDFGPPARVSGFDARWVSRFTAWLLENSPQTTVSSYLKRLRAALNWAVTQRMLAACPAFRIPSAQIPRGRAITLEEFERLLNAAEELPDAWVDPTQNILWGLWRSGLRLSELLDLHWSDQSHFLPIQNCRAIQIPAAKQKRRRSEVLPVCPEFTAWLLEQPEQAGAIFTAPGNADAVGRRISWCGQRAGIVVRRNDDGSPVFASAHDLRRSFATRWAKRGMPEAMLAALMRHRSVETTRVYYEDLSAVAVWEQMERLLGGVSGGASAGVVKRHAK